MPNFETLIVFFAAALAITLVPGPSMLYVASRSIVNGRTAGIFSALGLATGLLLHTALAALGLSTIFSYSPVVFFIIKYIGAIYLIYLGVKMIITKKSTSQSPIEMRSLSHLKIYRQGIIIEILNPKTALFFLSFLPQFVDPLQGSSALQMMLLGCILVFTALVADLFIAITSGTISKSVFAKPFIRKTQNWIAGTVLIALGLRLAISER